MANKADFDIHMIFEVKLLVCIVCNAFLQYLCIIYTENGSHGHRNPAYQEILKLWFTDLENIIIYIWKEIIQFNFKINNLN